MDYKQITTFLQILRDENMTKAAEHLYITQSTVSYRIKTLEEELGVELMERQKGTQSVAITDAGRQFVPIAEEWLSVYDKTDDFCRKQSAVKIRIAAPDSIHNLYRSKYKAIRSNNNIKLSLTTVNSDQVASILKAGKADLGFSFLEIKEKNLICDIEERFPLAVFILKNENEMPGTPAVADREPESAQELDPAKMIQIKGVGLDNPQVAEIIRDKFGSDIEGSAQYDTLSSILNNADAGEWGVIPYTSADQIRYHENITVVPFDDDHCKVNLYRVERAKMPSKIEMLINTYF